MSDDGQGFGAAGDKDGTAENNFLFISSKDSGEPALLDTATNAQLLQVIIY